MIRKKRCNIPVKAIFDEKVILLNNFENSKILRKSTVILVYKLPLNSLVWQYFKKIII